MLLKQNITFPKGINTSWKVTTLPKLVVNYNEKNPKTSIYRNVMSLLKQQPTRAGASQDLEQNREKNFCRATERPGY